MRNGYDVFFGGTLLPVTPGQMTLTMENRNETIELIDGGAVNLLKAPGLAKIQFTALLPDVPYPFAKYEGGIENFVAGTEWVNYLEWLKVNRIPFQFIVARWKPSWPDPGLFETNLTVSLEEYKIVEDAANGYDLSADISLKQYRHYATKTFTAASAEPGAPLLMNQTRPYVGAPAKQPGVFLYGRVPEELNSTRKGAKKREAEAAMSAQADRARRTGS